jgi:hypothetical protein
LVQTGREQECRSRIGAFSERSEVFEYLSGCAELTTEVSPDEPVLDKSSNALEHKRAIPDEPFDVVAICDAGNGVGSECLEKALRP